MKKIIVPIFAIASFAFVACSSDDDSDNGSASDASKIVGTWYLNHYESISREEENQGGSIHIKGLDAVATSSNIVWEIKANPQEIEYSGEADIAHVSYEFIDGDTISYNTYTHTLPIFEGDLFWSLDEENGTISLAPDGSYPANYTLTDDELRIWRNESSGGSIQSIEVILSR